MIRNIAIKGNAERGNKIIELLEMMGGKNSEHFTGRDSDRYYFIDDNTKRICSENVYEMEMCYNGVYMLFSYDYFNDDYPWRIGDIVNVIGRSNRIGLKIVKMQWGDAYNTMMYCLDCGEDGYGWWRAEDIQYNDFKVDLNDYENKFGTTKEPLELKSNAIKLVNGKLDDDCETHFCELVKNIKENNMENCKCSEYEGLKKVAHLSINDKDYADQIEVNLGDDYEYKFEMNRLYILKKKPKYPTTYEECWKVRFEVDGETTLKEFHNVSGYYSEPLGALQKLLCCRDAYWKIAGEEMGLGKPWKPNDETEIYNIYRTKNIIRLGGACWGGNCNILEFPTEKMRDAFYGNFKDLIEQCKELI